MTRETQRMVDLLRVSLRVLGISNREVARSLEMSPSYLSKLLSGRSPLRLDHVVIICGAVGMKPEEVFGLAYPVPAAKASATATRLKELLHGSPPSPPPPEKGAEPLSEEQMEEMMKRVVEKLMRPNGGSREAGD